MARYEAVLFDLDGTINDSGPGIMNSIQYALDRMGYPPLPEETLKKFVGPSLLYSFQTFCGMNEEEAERAIVLYREYYSAGEAYNLTIYEGIPELLQTLQENGVPCAVVTSKPQLKSEDILEHFDMLRYFRCVSGPSPEDGSNQKSILIRRALQSLDLLAEKAVMVGDTRFDIIGAVQAGCDSIGVTYGYGTEEELRDSGADYLASCAREIGRIVGLPQYQGS